MDGEIFVSSKIPKHTLCMICESKDRILLIELESEEDHLKTYLCNNCSKELRTQLDMMVGE